jgi:hypothetical protein
MSNLESAHFVQKGEFVAEVVEEFMTITHIQSGRHRVCPDCLVKLVKTNRAFTIPHLHQAFINNVPSFKRVGRIPFLDIGESEDCLKSSIDPATSAAVL